MDEGYRQPRFDADPAAPDAEELWVCWLRSFTSYISFLDKDADRLAALVNHVSTEVYAIFADCCSYAEAIAKLHSRFAERRKEMLARHLLANRRQEAGETLDHYVFALLQLSQNCGFRAVSARDHCEEAIRDAFIHGLRAAPVRQRLLETAQPSLAAAAARARVLTLLHQQAETYGAPAMPPDAVAAAPMYADAAASAPGSPRDAHDIADGGETEEPSIMLLDAAIASLTDADAAGCTPGPPHSVPGIADGGETEGPVHIIILCLDFPKQPLLS